MFVDKTNIHLIQLSCISTAFRRVCETAESDTELCHVYQSGWTNSTPAGQTFINLIFEDISKISPRTFKFDYNLTKITGTFEQDVHVFNNIFFLNNKYVRQSL
jgi:hypothetical protein